jgi:hypothetical protein
MSNDELVYMSKRLHCTLQKVYFGISSLSIILELHRALCRHLSMHVVSVRGM